MTINLIRISSRKNRKVRADRLPIGEYSWILRCDFRLLGFRTIFDNPLRISLVDEPAIGEWREWSTGGAFLVLRFSFMRWFPKEAKP